MRRRPSRRPPSARRSACHCERLLLLLRSSPHQTDQKRRLQASAAPRASCRFSRKSVFLTPKNLAGINAGSQGNPNTNTPQSFEPGASAPTAALSEPTLATPAERAPSRERAIVPTERRRPRRACADRAVDTRVRRVVCAIVCRVTSPRLLLSASHRRFGSVRADTGDARRASERRAASESQCRPSAADLVVRTPIVPSTHARAVSCAPSCVERPTTPMTRRRGGRRGALHCKITGVPRPR